MIPVAVGLAILLGLALLLSEFVALWLDSEVVMIDDFTPEDLQFVLTYERRVDNGH